MNSHLQSYSVFHFCVEMSKSPLLKQLLEAAAQDDPNMDNATLTLRVVPGLVNLLRMNHRSVQVR